METGSSKNKSSQSLMPVKLAFEIIMFVFSVVVFLSLVTGGTLFGAAGRAINAFVLGLFGQSAYPVFVAAIYFSIKLFSEKKYNSKKKSALCVLILFISAVLCYHLLTTSAAITSAASYPQYISICFEAGNLSLSGVTGGGVLFALIAYPVYGLFGLTGSFIIYALIFAVTVVIMFNGRNTFKENEIQGVKEYPADFFNPQEGLKPEAKEYTLPRFEAKTESIAPQETAQEAANPAANPNIVPAPKKLFVGFIDDYVNARTKRAKPVNKSFDILYSSAKIPREEGLSKESAPETKNSALGGSSYVDTFGDDMESKKKYILTPVNNILRPEEDYGARIFPINLKQQGENPQKPPRINHNMITEDNIPAENNPVRRDRRYLGGETDSHEKENKNNIGFLTGYSENEKDYGAQDEGNSYERYANEKEEDINIQKTEPQREIPVKPDFLNNLAQLRQKYISAANEKSTFAQNEGGEKDLDAKPREEPLKSGILQTHIAGKSDSPEIRTPYAAPLMSLMNDIFFDKDQVAENYEEKVAALENTLNEFKVPAKVVSVTPGPTVTRYELQMPPGIPVSKLTSRANDIAMCLASNGEIRIEAPIPGKSLLGIELPNKKRQKVGIKEVIDSEEFINNKSPVAFGLGKDITGKNIILDFTKIPHLLVAGSTGSGKSVCLNTLIISILYKSSPEDVRLILIDPKRVEFNVYNGLPHLMLKEVITDGEKAISAFNWAINEMNRRFELFRETNAKDITSYNEKIKNTGEQKLPRIMIIVDELAELMMINKKELEDKIKKISQLSRAAGIHLILATQRPSVDIITGVIKANLSSRVTFKLMTQADSRTVLDCSGAEKLLGEGDMIFISNNMPKPVRLQGPYISMGEVENIVEYVKKNNRANFDEVIEEIISNPASLAETEADESGEAAEEDKFFIEALRLAVETGQISISMVQRRFAVGYSRAGKIIDDMERQHFISPFEGSKPRQVLISKEEFNRRFGEG